MTADAREEAGGTKDAAAVVDGAGERTVEHKRLWGITAMRTTVTSAIKEARQAARSCMLWGWAGRDGGLVEEETDDAVQDEEGGGGGGGGDG